MKGKLDTENSLLNFRKINCNLSNEIIKLNNSNNMKRNNLIINELKNESPNFNGNKRLEKLYHYFL